MKYKDIKITNFRELGGISTSDGKKVKEGYLFRSGPITFKNNDEKKVFEEIHIQNILDLRSQQEVDSCHDEMIDGCNYIHISAIANDTNFDMTSFAFQDEFTIVKKMFSKIYEDLPFSNPAYKKMFEILENHESILFHCSAGKDRTGVAAMLILKLLGVDDEVIIQDYLKSNECLDKQNIQFLENLGNESLKELLYVKKEYILLSLNAISSKYESFEQFLLEEYQLDDSKIQNIKDFYLEEVHD